MKINWNVYISIISLMGILMFYQNCTSGQSSVGEVGHFTSVQNNLNIEACSTMKQVFELSYRPFLETNCKNCHITNGAGKGAFADDSMDVAWSAFQLATYSKVSDFAVNPGHNAPFTGSKHQNKINSFRERWVIGLEEQVRCQNTEDPGNGNIGARFNTSPKMIGLANVGDSKVIEWNLSTEIAAEAGLTLPKMPGAVFSVKVEVVNVLDQIAYYISDPRIYASAVDLHINSLRTKINGEYIAGETTFTFVDKDVYKNSDTLLSAGTMVALGQNNSADQLQISFGKLEAADLPPPDLGPEVSFKMAKQDHVESGKVSLEVSLSRAPAQAVVVQVEFDKTTVGKLRRSPRTEEEPYDYFDWDFTLGTVATPALNRTLTFVPGGALTQSFDVLISDDNRDEPNEKAVLSITNIENGVRGAFTKHTINVTDDDEPSSNPFLKTFSELMTGNGVLNQRCMECHNTVRKEGGYDMTDYGSMTALVKKILVPGDPQASEMYKRLRLEGTGRMPLDQALDPSDQRAIENWILDGAKNN